MLSKVKYFIIDMDGTFYLGDNLIEGSLDFLKAVKENGRDFMFFTNNSSNNKTVCAERLKKLGCDIEKEKIILSTDVSIDYIEKNYPGKTVYLLGNERLTAEFEKSSIKLVDDNPDIVVLGFDTTLTYEKIRKAAMFIANGCTYIATHPDFNCPTADGFMPDTGSMIELFYASTNKRPQVLGKPMTPTVDYVTDLLGCNRDEIAFIGDRLETDIKIGCDHNITSILVFSGVTSEEDYTVSDIKATIAVERLEKLIALL